MKIYLSVMCALIVSTRIFAQIIPMNGPLPEKESATKSLSVEKNWEVGTPGSSYERQSEPIERAFTFLQNIPCISPLESGESPRISSPFGMRVHPFDKILKSHLGVDLVCQKGFQFVYATANGQVAFAGNRGGLGLAIEVNHVRGYTTGYGHLGSTFVRAGDLVRIGEVLGVMGSSGRATGIHLHYSVIKDGYTINPLPYLTLYEDFIKEMTPQRRH